jgi:hypothetical protein
MEDNNFLGEQLGIYEYPLIIRDNNKQLLYLETFDHVYDRYIYDNNSNITYYEFKNGIKEHWSRREYDENENIIFYESKDGFWARHEYDKEGYIIYSINSEGLIVDNRNEHGK